MLGLLNPVLCYVHGIRKTFSYKYTLTLISYYPQIIPHLGHDIFYINPTFVGLHHQDHEIGALIDHDFRKSCATLYSMLSQSSIISRYTIKAKGPKGSFTLHDSCLLPQFQWPDMF